MAFKILALTCLVAVALASPTFDVAGGVHKNAGGLLGGVLGNVLGGVGGTVNGVLKGVGGLVDGLLGDGGISADGKVNVGLNLGGLLGILGNAVTNVAGDAGVILKDLSQLRIPGTLDDVLNLVIGVGASLGGVLNAVIPGSGGPVGNLVIGLFKILICVLGSPGLTGNLLGDSRPGYNNPRDIPAICGPKFGVDFGLKPYDGDYKNVDGVINFYGLGDIDDKLRALLDKATDGEGLDGLDGSNYLVAKWLLDLSSLVKARYDNNNWDQKDTIQVIINLSKILGGIGNGYKSNFGKRLVYQLFQYLKASTKNSSSFKNFDWSKYQSEIFKQISKCNRASFNGTFKNEDDKSYKNVENDKDVEYNYNADQDKYDSDETNESETDNKESEQNNQQNVQKKTDSVDESNYDNSENNETTNEKSETNNEERSYGNDGIKPQIAEDDFGGYEVDENGNYVKKSGKKTDGTKPQIAEDDFGGYEVDENGNYVKKSGKKTDGTKPQIAEDDFGGYEVDENGNYVKKSGKKTDGTKPQIAEDDFGGYVVDENGNYVKKSGSYTKNESSKTSSSKKSGKNSSGCSKTVTSANSNY